MNTPCPQLTAWLAAGVENAVRDLLSRETGYDPDEVTIAQFIETDARYSTLMSAVISAMLTPRTVVFGRGQVDAITSLSGDGIVREMTFGSRALENDRHPAEPWISTGPLTPDELPDAPVILRFETADAVCAHRGYLDELITEEERRQHKLSAQVDEDRKEVESLARADRRSIKIREGEKS